MKHIVVLMDGAADTPVGELGGKTPLEAANKPNIDRLASLGEMGMVKTVPDNLQPASDVANLAVFGYDPQKYYTGRSPLEAVSMGVELLPTDTAFRTNLVTLSDEPNYADKTMIDYSSDEIPTDEAHILIDAVNKALKTDEYEFFGGTSYRHLLVWHNKDGEFKFTPPHDISDRKITDYLPDNKTLLSLMERSYDILKDHPLNADRVKRGLRPANSIWIWGNGKRPMLDSYASKFNLKGAVISAVDLIKGIGKCAGLDVINVDGATGNIKTNFDGKGKAAVEALRGGADFIYIHLEAPDEAGHRHEIDNKVRSIELIDEKIVAPIINAMDEDGEAYKILIMPDHPTPLATRTHSREPIPYLVFDSANADGEPKQTSYTEANAKETGIFIPNGYTIIEKIL